LVFTRGVYAALVSARRAGLIDAIRKAYTPQMPRKRNTARRGRLLDAGIAVFAAKGVSEATVEDIAAAAGVAKGAFYLDFASKDDFIAALKAQWVADFGIRQRSAMERLPPEDWLGRLDAWVAAGVEAYHSSHEFHDVLFRHDTEAVAAGEHAKAAWDDSGVVADLTQFLAEGTDAGVFVVADAKTVAFLLYGMYAWAADHALHHRDDVAAVRQIVSVTQQLFRRAVTRPDPRPAAEPTRRRAAALPAAAGPDPQRHGATPRRD
jgi:AcrR family transcriptional regulator